MAQMTPQEFSNKWANNLGASEAAIKRGVDRVTESPTAKAAERDDLYLRKVQESVQSGKRRAALLRVTTEDWKKAFKEKGIPRISTGARAAIPKMERFANEFIPFTEDVSRQIQAMPKGTEGDAEARMLATVRLMRKFRRSQ